MRQEQFVARYQREWQAFEHWLETRGDARKAGAERNTSEIGDEDIPAAGWAVLFRFGLGGFLNRF